MKSILKNKLLLVLIGGGAIVGFGVGIFLFTNNSNETKTNTTNSNNKSVSNDDFQRTGQYSFGVAVCDEMTKEEVSNVINKTVIKTEDYSNSGSTGCEYFVSDLNFVIIDVGYSDMENQRTGLLAIDRTIKSDSRIKLDNMLVYSEKGLIDIYMNVAEGKKFVRVGRSSVNTVDEETLINLAISTEAKIRSFK